MAEWDKAVDFIVVGSGGGGMVAALAAADSGASVLVLEKQSLIGGSTAMSGGVVWMPNNRQMRKAGVRDSHDDALAHFDAVVGDVGPGSSRERREAFLTRGLEMLSLLEQHGVRFAYCSGYSDYYPDEQGGVDRGRAVEPVPYRSRRLGPLWSKKLQPGLAKSLGMAVMTNEARYLSNYNRSLKAFAVSARVAVRTVRGKVGPGELLTNGASLIAQILGAALAKGVEIWTDAALDGLVAEDGKVLGVRATHDGVPLSIQARRGVLISAGGFAHNPEMRAEYGGDQPNKGKWSMANAGDTGEAIKAAMRLGAQTDLMDESWWMPSPRTGRFGQSTLDQARQRPHTMYVDVAGRRFVNESNSYMEVGKAMYERNKTTQAVPCWLIFDDRYRRRYAHVRSHPGWFPKEFRESGRLKQAATIRELAAECGIDPDGLAETIETFNTHAANGRDPEYGRGESAYNKALGDPNRRLPNPAVGPIDTPPFYAVDVVPGDLGTCGGLLTDEHARVLGPGGAPIPGLYATGNSTATVMGRHYLGPGASIANSMVFGYVAATDAAGSGQAQ